LALVTQTKKLQESYKANPPKTKEEGQKTLDQFLKDQLYPALEMKCQELGIKKEKCYPLKRKWNNASLAAFLTYEKSMDKIHTLRTSKGLSLLEFFSYIEGEYDAYRNSTSKDSFETWFLK
jgi:uncharacterized protein YbaP (TraB family)